MGREDRAGSNLTDRLFELLSTSHQFRDSFHCSESGMAFIEMDHGRYFFQQSKGAESTDTQKNLPLQSKIIVALIQTGGQGPVFDSIAGQIGIKEIQGNSTHGH